VVSRADQAVSLGLQDATVRRRMNDAGFNPTSAKWRWSSASASPVRYGQVIRQTGIRLEQ
jgi:hypothetical protein